MIALFSVLTILSILGFIVNLITLKEYYEKKSVIISYPRFLLIMVLFTISSLSLCTFTQLQTRKKTSIECLRGKNTYEMEIRYKKDDIYYIPVDTIFRKK